MLSQLTLLTLSLTTLLTAMPTDFQGRPIIEVIPRDIHTSNLDLRDVNVIVEAIPGVYICTGEHWTGNCYWEDRVPNQCHKYHLGKTSSFGPDSGVVCGLYDDDHCGGTPRTVVFPGLAAGLGADVKSWMCG